MIDNPVRLGRGEYLHIFSSPYHKHQDDVRIPNIRMERLAYQKSTVKRLGSAQRADRNDNRDRHGKIAVNISKHHRNPVKHEIAHEVGE
jgi:hypothetical protein